MIKTSERSLKLLGLKVLMSKLSTELDIPRVDEQVVDLKQLLDKFLLLAQEEAVEIAAEKLRLEESNNG